MFVHGHEPYPAERTLLTTGAVEAVMRSYELGGKQIENLLTRNLASAKIVCGIHSLPFIGAIDCSVLDVSSTLKEPQQAR